MLFGACVMPLNVYSHAPAFLMGMDFAGWKAAAFFVAMGMLDAVIGIGLLRAATWSRMAAICFFVFRITNMSVTFLLPRSLARFEASIELTRQSLGLASGPERSPAWFGGAVELCGMAAILWSLFTRKQAFLPPGAEGGASEPLQRV